MLPDDDNLMRFVQAVALGHIADEEFAHLCRRLGVDADVSAVSPLDAVTRQARQPDSLQ